MVGVVGSSPIAPTKYRKQNQSLQRKCPLTSGHFFVRNTEEVRKTSTNSPVQSSTFQHIKVLRTHATLPLSHD